MTSKQKTSSTDLTLISVKNGLEVLRHPDGHIMHTITWRNNAKHGPETAYHKNGVIQCETPWTNGKKDGMETWFREDGTKEMEILWEKGKRSLVTNCFDEKGVKSFGIITDGKNHNQHVRLFYDTKGAITGRALYTDGMRCSPAAMDAFLDNIDKKMNKTSAVSRPVLVAS